MSTILPFMRSKNEYLRKSATIAGIAIHKIFSRRYNASGSFYFVNSFPKSGTHLLDQVVHALPHANDYGRFLSSMTSSYRFRLRSERESCNYLSCSRFGEVLRGHLFFAVEYEEILRERNAVAFFIYRDLRDVAISEAIYLRDMNRWHRLHKYFKGLSNEESVNLCIRGIGNADVYYPNIAERFRLYRPWITSATCTAIQFERLVSTTTQGETLRQIAHASDRNSKDPIDEQAIIGGMRNAIKPTMSHTFRAAKIAGWKCAMTDANKRLFKEVAGHLIIELGYEANNQW